MAVNSGGIRLTLGGRELGLDHSAFRIAELFKQGSGHLMRTRRPQMGIHGDKPGTPYLIDIHAKADLPVIRTTEPAIRGTPGQAARVAVGNE